MIGLAESHLTKNALSEAMKELMVKYPMEKIKINDIVELCNMSRQSFYYHFKDKYDLVNWIFYTELIKNINDSLEQSGWSFIEKVCEYFYENKVFYSNALKVKGQNSFSDYFTEVLHPLIHTQIEEIIGDDPNRDFYVTFFADAIRVSITRWLLEGAFYSPKEFVELLKHSITGVVYELIKDSEDNREKSEG